MHLRADEQMLAAGSADNLAVLAAQPQACQLHPRSATAARLASDSCRLYIQNERHQPWLLLLLSSSQLVCRAMNLCIAAACHRLPLDRRALQ